MDCVTRDQFKFIRDYARRGGGLLLSTEDFLCVEKLCRTIFRNLTPTSEEEGGLFQRSTAYLGIKPYQSDISPTWVRFDADFIPVAEGPVALPLSPMARSLTTPAASMSPLRLQGMSFQSVMRCCGIMTPPLGQILWADG